MGEFRDRMERDLQIRGFSSSTRQCYLARMKAMVRFFMRPPDELTLEDIQSYQLHLTRDRQVCWSSFNQSVGAIRFFYGVTLNRDWHIRRIPYQKTGRKLPVVLSGSCVGTSVTTGCLSTARPCRRSCILLEGSGVALCGGAVNATT